MLEAARTEQARGRSEPGALCTGARRWAHAAWMSAALVSACDLPAQPAAADAVYAYDGRTGEWFDSVGAELELGDTFVHEGRVLRLTEEWPQLRGQARLEELAEADQPWVARPSQWMPDTDDWVLVLGSADDAGLWRLSDVEPGDRFAFGGRIFATRSGDAGLEVRSTGEVLGRVTRTHARTAGEVVDLVVSRSESSEVLTGTPEHPVWVPAVGAYVPMGELEVGTVLRDAEGGAAVVGEVRWSEAEQRVYNFEVAAGVGAEAHSTFVQAEGGVGAGVLVHNGCTRASKAGGKGVNELPALDSTGKDHGELPKPKDLGDYEVEDLQQLRDEPGQSVEERIRKNSELGPKGGHGERQAAEQDLIKSIDKHLEDR